MINKKTVFFYRLFFINDKPFIIAWIIIIICVYTSICVNILASSNI